MDMLGKLFGGGDDDNDHKANAQDFISRYQQGPIDQGYSDEEAIQHYQNVAQHADPATMQRASEQAFSNMSPDQRLQMAQLLQQQHGGQGTVSNDPRQMAGMVSQLHQQNPGGLASLLGGGNSGGGGLGGGLGGLLGGGNSGGGALGGLLGGGGNSGGGGGFPGGTLGKVALGGIAAYAMKEIMGGGNDNDNKQKRSV